MTIRSYHVLVALILSFLAACVPAVNRSSNISMERGIIATPNVTITAEDNSFTLVSGTEFKPPFQVNTSNMIAKIIKKYRKGGSAVMREDYGEFLNEGARRVMVNVAGKQLYGVLSLNTMLDGAYGPASRMYQIEIPQEYIAGASGGRVSVVFENVDVQDPKHGSLTAQAWILWLSDMPIR